MLCNVCLLIDFSASQKFQAQSVEYAKEYATPCRLDTPLHPFQITNCSRAVEEHCQVRQVRDRGKPEEHHPDPTSSSLTAQDNPMDGTTEFLEETWYCFYEHQVVLMFSSSPVKLRQHIWDAKEAHCTAACLSKSTRRAVKQPGFIFSTLWKTEISPLWVTPSIPDWFLFPLLSNNTLSLGLIIHLLYCKFGNLALEG